MDFKYKDYLAKIHDDELIAELEYYGYDPYYSEFWKQTIEEIAKRLKERNKELE